MNSELIRQLISNWNAPLCTASAENIAVSVAPVDDYTPFLSEKELSLISRSVQKRRMEFSTGRILARKCMEIIRQEASEVLQGEHREPLWCNGLKGSLSHNNLLCAAAVTDCASISSIGIDIEQTDKVTQDLWEHLFSTEEREYISGTHAPLETATVFFSAKEAFYKMQFPLTGLIIDFKDAEITVHGNSFSVSCRITADPFFRNTFTGNYFVTDNNVFTIISLRRGQYE